MQLAAAAAPIVMVLLLLLIRVPSLWAGLIGVTAAVLGAAWMFPLDAPGAAAAVSSMGPTVLQVALILLGGVGLAQVMRVSGAQDHIAGWLEATERGTDRTATLLLLVFGLTPFMESVTGFGLGVVITAPLLIRLGLTPVKAVVSGLLGLVLVPWGSMGPGTLVAAELGAVDFHQLGVWSALLTPPVLIVSMAAVLLLNVGRPSLRQVALGATIIVVQWVVLLLASLLVGPPLTGVLASAAVIVLLLVRTRVRTGPLPGLDPQLRRALVPYALLTAGILAATAVLAATGARDSLGWVASPGLWLVISATAALTMLDRAHGSRLCTTAEAVARWVPIAANALAFLLLGIVMAVTGMAEHLASVAAQAGAPFVALLPVVGALGGYLTGSNTGAAAMFSAATATSAAQLGADPLIALAGQNVAGSFANIASPPRIALAVGVAMTAGQGLPGPAMRTLVGAVTLVAIVTGAFVYVLA